MIVVALHPHHFNFTFGIGELANEAEKFPVFFFQASKIEVGKDVAQQNQPAILMFCKTRNASRARLMSAPRCRSERISVS